MKLILLNLVIIIFLPLSTLAQTPKIEITKDTTAFTKYKVLFKNESDFITDTLCISTPLSDVEKIGFSTWNDNFIICYEGYRNSKSSMGLKLLLKKYTILNQRLQLNETVDIPKAIGNPLWNWSVDTNGTYLVLRQGKKCYNVNLLNSSLNKIKRKILSLIN